VRLDVCLAYGLFAVLVYIYFDNLVHKPRNGHKTSFTHLEIANLHPSALRKIQKHWNHVLQTAIEMTNEQHKQDEIQNSDQCDCYLVL